MRSFLRYDSFLNQTLIRLADCFCLSLLWTLCCLPVITTGAATAALYYAINKGVRQGDSGIWRLFWRGFRVNFKQATLVWLLMLPLFGLLLGSVRVVLALYLANQISLTIPILLVAAGGCVLLWAVYLFPHIATFECGTLQLLKNCQLMAAKHPVRSVFLLGVLVAEILALCYIPLGLLFVPGVCMWATTMLLNPVFREYMPEDTAVQI